LFLVWGCVFSENPNANFILEFLLQVKKVLHRLKNLTLILICVSGSERGERERKGDLDQYERVDGDRNVTSRLLAVKKVSLILLNTTLFPMKLLYTLSSINSCLNYDS